MEPFNISEQPTKGKSYTKINVIAIILTFASIKSVSYFSNYFEGYAECLLGTP